MKRYTVTLTREDREVLAKLTSKGEHRSQTVFDALILLGCDEGEFQKRRSTSEEIARLLNTSMRKIDRVKRRFVEGGLETVIHKRKSNRICLRKMMGI